MTEPWTIAGMHAPPESDLGNALRIVHHASDRLSWRSDGWRVYSRGVSTLDEPGALCVAAMLPTWIEAEALQMEQARTDAEAVRRRRAWAAACADVSRMEAALKLARGFLSTPARPADADEWQAIGQPSHREQVLAAALAVLAADDGAVRADSSGRVVASRLAAAIDREAPRYWPGTGAPPLNADDMGRLLSNALRGRIAPGAAAAAESSFARNSVNPASVDQSTRDEPGARVLPESDGVRVCKAASFG